MDRYFLFWARCECSWSGKNVCMGASLLLSILQGKCSSFRFVLSVRSGSREDYTLPVLFFSLRHFPYSDQLSGHLEWPEDLVGEDLYDFGGETCRQALYRMGFVFWRTWCLTSFRYALLRAQSSNQYYLCIHKLNGFTSWMMVGVVFAW